MGKHFEKAERETTLLSYITARYLAFGKDSSIEEIAIGLDWSQTTVRNALEDRGGNILIPGLRRVSPDRTLRRPVRFGPSRDRLAYLYMNNA